MQRHKPVDGGVESGVMLGALGGLVFGSESKRLVFISGSGGGDADVSWGVCDPPVTLMVSCSSCVVPSCVTVHVHVPASEAATGFSCTSADPGWGLPSGLRHCAGGAGVRPITRQWRMASAPRDRSGEGVTETGGGGVRVGEEDEGGWLGWVIPSEVPIS